MEDQQLISGSNLILTVPNQSLSLQVLQLYRLGTAQRTTASSSPPLHQFIRETSGKKKFLLDSSRWMASSSSLAIRCAENHGVSSRRLGLDNNPANQRTRRPCSLTMSKRAESKGQTGRTISVKMAAKTTEKLEQRRTRGNDATVAGEKLDDWMRRSVVDIVKNLREAPLMVQVYGDDEKPEEYGGGVTRIETEKGVVEEDWLAAKGKWDTGEAPVPQGLIFVEELEEEEEERSERESMTRAWGVVVQGRGAECGPVCYLLKTSRVRGLGSMFCTHFCLAKVNGFRESAASQLKNCWLLQAASFSRLN